jgi:thiol-disulfide isomerase/thioredoxin
MLKSSTADLKLTSRLPFAFLIAILFVTGVGASEKAISWTEDYDAAVQRAAGANSVLMLHFYTDNCPPCKLLDKKTFLDSNVINTINENVVPVRINADRRRDLVEKYNVTRWPTDIYLFPNGDEIYRGVSDQDPSVYVQKIKRISLRNRDWNIEQMAIAKAKQRRQDQAIAAQTPQIQAERPVYAGSAGQSVKSQSSQWTNKIGLSQTAASNANPTPPVARVGQRVIENPYISKQPVVVPPAKSAQDPILAEQPTELAPIVQAPSTPVLNRFEQPNTATSDASLAKAPVPAQPIATRRPVPVAVGPAAAGVSVVAAGSPELQRAPESGPSFANHFPHPSQSVSQPQEPQQQAFPPAVDARQPGFIQSPSMASQAAPSQPRAAERPTMDDAASQRVVTDTIGLGGYCPVTLIESLNKPSESGWVKGSSAFAVRHRGRVYNCVSEKARQTLLADPDRYTPCLSGFDLVHFCKTGTLIDGEVTFGRIQSQTDRVFLFANEANCKEFERDSEYYARLLENATRERVARGNNETQLR